MIRKPSYEELELKVEQIGNELLAKEIEVDSLKSLFLANISHEVRTPMNAIVGFSNLLSDPSYNANQKNFFIEEINKNSKDLLRLIDNILISSKLQTDNFKTSPTICSPKKILQKLYKSHLLRLKNSIRTNLKLSLILNESESEIELFTDPFKLEIALSNLIDNAIKFTASGFVEFGCSYSASSVRFFIKDTGKGISTKNIDHIFKNFYQENVGFESTEPGLGISLSLSDKIINLLGGKLLVVSVPGEGSTFSFQIPVRMGKKAGV